jgi:hypothetical protein
MWEIRYWMLGHTVYCKHLYYGGQWAEYSAWRPANDSFFLVGFLFTRRKLFEKYRIYATKISRVQFINFFLLLLRHFGPFSGHGLPVVGVLRQLSFHVARMLVRSPTHRPGGPGYISLPGTSLAACWTRLVLTTAMLSPAYLASQLVHASSISRLTMP